MYKIKVVIVDDDSNWIKEMSKILNREQDIIVVGTAFTKEDAIKLVNNIDIDILLMDINLSGNKCDGITATLEISKIKKIKTIMLTSLCDEKIITNSFAAGAVNYISKENYKDIPNAIRLAYQNKSPIETLANEFSRLKKEEQLRELSNPEREIYDLIEQGHTRSQIENKLFKSKNTIKMQIRSLLSKLGVNNSKEAVRKVNDRGINEDL